MNYYRGDIVTDLEGVDRYRVINDNGNTLDIVPYVLSEPLEENMPNEFECDKKLFSLVNRPVGVRLYRFTQSIKSLFNCKD